MNINYGFDYVWEEVHSEKEWGKYPPEELVRFILGQYKNLSKSKRKEIKILELGIGQGANAWFLAREGFDIFGIDGSKTAIKKAYNRFEALNLNGNFHVGDFNKISEFKDESFDIIIDVASLQCNNLDYVDEIINESRKKLKPNGRMFSMMIAKGSYGDGLGEKIDDNTFTKISDGPFAGLGTVHFFQLSEVKELFNSFNDVTIEYSTRSLLERKEKIKHWIISAQK